MSRGDRRHHVVDPPELFAAVKLERMGEGLLQFGGFGGAETPRIALTFRHSASCAPGAASRTTRKPAVSSAAASCLPLAVTKAGGPPDTRAAASASTAATSSNGTGAGEG